jgi:Putative prokaryotic signal transducing protein
MSLVEAGKYYNSFEAGLAQSRLEEAGIDSVLFDLEMATYGIGLSIPVRLMVLDDDLQIATKVLQSSA